MKICLVRAELFRADRRDEADNRFSQFCGKRLEGVCFIDIWKIEIKQQGLGRHLPVC